MKGGQCDGVEQRNMRRTLGSSLKHSHARHRYSIWRAERGILIDGLVRGRDLPSGRVKVCSRHLVTQQRWVVSILCRCRVDSTNVWM